MATKKTTMTKCPACGKAVSSAAASCPGCGHPICGGVAGGINMKDPVHFIGVVAGGIIVAMFLIGIIVGTVGACMAR